MYRTTSRNLPSTAMEEAGRASGPALEDWNIIRYKVTLATWISFTPEHWNVPRIHFGLV